MFIVIQVIVFIHMKIRSVWEEKLPPETVYESCVIVLLRNCKYFSASLGKSRYSVFFE